MAGYFGAFKNDRYLSILVGNGEIKAFLKKLFNFLLILLPQLVNVLKPASFVFVFRPFWSFGPPCNPEKKKGKKKTSGEKFLFVLTIEFPPHIKYSQFSLTGTGGL